MMSMALMPRHPIDIRSGRFQMACMSARRARAPGMAGNISRDRFVGGIDFRRFENQYPP